jgi:phage baseplate assembly protein W
MNEQLKGMAFPFRIINGSVSTAEGFTKIEQNIIHLLSTNLGERVALRTYGGGVHHRLQDPNVATLHTLVKLEIEDALRAFMPDVQLVAPIELNAQGETLTISVEYRADPRAILRRLEVTIQ